MVHQHSSPLPKRTVASFGLAQMGVLSRLAIVLPAILVIWTVLWLLVRA